MPNRQLSQLMPYGRLSDHSRLPIHLGLGRTLLRVPLFNLNYQHLCAGRKTRRSPLTFPVLEPGPLPPGRESYFTGTGAGCTGFRQRYHSSSLGLGGALVLGIAPISSVMITATDPLPGPVEPILRTEGSKLTQPLKLRFPGLPEGAYWAQNPVSLHWCRDQDACIEMCMYARFLTTTGGIDSRVGSNTHVLMFFLGSHNG